MQPRVLWSFALSLGLSGVLTAQCPFTSVTMQSLSQPCGQVFLNPATLGASLDVNTCRLGFTVNAFTGCCNTFLRGRALALSTQSTLIPVPFAGPNCFLMVQPDWFLIWLPAAGDTTWLQIPPNLPPLSFLAQGGAIYVTFGVSTDVLATGASTVSLQ